MFCACWEGARGFGRGREVGIAGDAIVNRSSIDGGSESVVACWRGAPRKASRADGLGACFCVDVVEFCRAGLVLVCGADEVLGGRKRHVRTAGG